MLPTTAVGYHVNKSSAVAKMGDSLITIYMGRKVFIADVPLCVGELAQLGSHLKPCSLGQGLPT